MEKREYESYKNHIDELLDRTLFSYPFYDKSDDELISDARKRTGSNIEFGLFKLGEPSVKEVFVDNDFIETKYFTLTSTLNTSESPIEIKLSSFIFPLFFFHLYLIRRRS